LLCWGEVERAEAYYALKLNGCQRIFRRLEPKILSIYTGVGVGISQSNKTAVNRLCTSVRFLFAFFSGFKCHRDFSTTTDLRHR
jgi:hypothetical protein